MAPKECDITVPGSPESVHVLCDCAHTMVMLRRSISSPEENHLEIEPSDPEMGVCFPPRDFVPSATDFRDNANIWFDMSGL